MPNNLIHESSPYLLQHAHNPVNWYPWGDEAIGRARDEKKLIFLSIGYSSCHWCHVMERESFEDEKTAHFLNEHYIAIKVDREERPDIDAVYMEAVQIMGQQGGWPLNVWLTPELDPVFGGTYFPKTTMHGRPSFMDVLQRLIQVFDPENPEIKDRIGRIRAALGQDLYTHIEKSLLSDEIFQQAAGVLKNNYDPVDGGFSPAPKFPMAMCIEFLIRLGAASPDRARTDMALNSLRKMICGGIYDQIGGGFHRYSTDTRWLVPHFEKMLYDQALLLSALVDAALTNDDPLFAETIAGTISFLRREMMDETGAFYSALDADTEGVEGRFYVWDWSELEKLLDPAELGFVRDFLGASETGNWEGVNILTGTPHAIPAEMRETSEIVRKKLLDERDKRVRPGLDDKVITSWNAMLLKSLCKAARAFNNGEWRQDALQLARFLTREMITADGLMRIWKNGRVSQPGFLDDHALLAESLTCAFELTGDESLLAHASGLCNILIGSFYDTGSKGFYYTASGQDELPVRTRNIFDNAEPSGTSAAISALWRTGMLTGETRFTTIAAEAAGQLANIASKHASAFGYLLNTAITMHHHSREIVISGPPSEEIRDALSGTYLPFSLIVEGPSFENSPLPTLKGKKPLENRTAIYICQNFTCQQPTLDVRDLPARDLPARVRRTSQS